MKNTILTFMSFLASTMSVTGTVAAQVSSNSVRSISVSHESGITLVSDGAEVWANWVCANQAGEERIVKRACRTVGFGLITNDVAPDKVVLCRGGFNFDDMGNCTEWELKPDEYESTPDDEILGVINPDGIPMWASRSSCSQVAPDCLGTYNSTNFVDINQDGRVEVLVGTWQEEARNSRFDLSVLMWSGGQMKVILEIKLSEEDSLVGISDRNLVELVFPSENDKYRFRVTPYSFTKSGKTKMNKQKAVEYEWNSDKTIFEEITTKKKKK